MGGGGDRRQAVIFGDFGNGSPEFGQIFPSIGDGGRDLGVDLDLSFQELMRHKSLNAFLAGPKQRFRRIAGDVPGFQVNQQVFLFDTDGETGSRGGHVNTPGLRECLS